MGRGVRPARVMVAVLGLLEPSRNYHWPLRVIQRVTCLAVGWTQWSLRKMETWLRNPLTQKSDIQI